MSDSSDEEESRKETNAFVPEIYSVRSKPSKTSSRRLPQAQVPTTQEENLPSMPSMPSMPEMPSIPDMSSMPDMPSQSQAPLQDDENGDTNDPITPVVKAPRTIATHPGAKKSFLDHRVTADDDELYDDNERALTALTKLHPMLCLDVTSQRVLEGASKLIGEYSIPTRDLEVVTKEHDDKFLRPAKTGCGERSCINGEKCLARWLATFRYGEDSPYHFTCREFLLPSQLQRFETSGSLPKQNGKCLLCVRYWHSYVFTLARTSPSFCPTSTIQVQAFGNAVGVADAGEIPSLSNAVDDENGYKNDVMLYADEKLAETNVARSQIGTMLWRPVVRFNSSDYVFVKPENKNDQPRIIQVGMSRADATPELLFQAPPSSQAKRTAA